MVLQPWPPGLHWKEIALHLCLVWVQIHGLPMDPSNELTERFIGGAIGEVLEVYGKTDTKIWCVAFIRVKVLLDNYLISPVGLHHLPW